MVSNVAAEEQKLTLDTILGAKLLKASERDTTLTLDEKLNVHRCKMVSQYLTLTSSAIDQTIKYSCTAPVVGVAFYAGNDLGHHSPEKIANHIEAEFAKNGVKARVFIQDGHSSGSNISYIVRGGREVMSPKEPYSAIKSIEGFVANMKLVYLADELISTTELGKWVKSEIAYLPRLNRIDG